MTQNRLLVKITASILVFTFSNSQILLAADVRQMLLDAKAFFEEQELERPHGMSVEDFEAAQAQQQATVEQQQMLEDFQNTSFNLTTPNGDVLKYVGDKLSSVQRPDGTQLEHIVTDAAGNIQSADLQLADGSVQLYQNGQVIGYMTPDGSQVIYSAGAVQKVIDKNGKETLYTYVKNTQGVVTETTLDGPTHITKYDANSKIKEATRKLDNQKIFYLNGIIDRIVNSDGSQVTFSKTVVNGDTVATPQGGVAPEYYSDTQGNKFYFSAGTITKIVLTDNSTVTAITWDANNKIDSATLTQTDLQKFIYQAKKLTRSYDAANVVTNYTHNATNILAVKSGNTWEYALDKTPIKYTTLAGDVKTYIQTGAYKGLIEKEKLATGQTFIYEYSGTAPTITVQKREVQATTYAISTVESGASLAQSTNPVFKTTVKFPNDGTIDQKFDFSATYSTTKNLKVTLVSGTGSTYTWNGTTTSLGVTLSKDVDYKVEVRWETGRIGIYVYNAASAKPSTPTKSVTDRAWDPKFKAVATNAAMVYDSTSSGYYNRNFSMREKGYATISTSAALYFDFTQLGATYKTIELKAFQAQSGNIKRTITLFNNSTGLWSFKISDYNTSTLATTNTTTTLQLPFVANKNYRVDLLLEGTKLNLYIYDKGAARPVTPTASFTAFAVSTALELYTVNGLANGQTLLLKNRSTPAYSSAFAATPLTPRVDTIKNSTLVKMAAPGASVNSTDFTSIKYDSLANLKEVILKDGSKLIFDKGILKQALNAAGALTSFNFEQSGLSNIVGSTIVQNNLTSTYSADGKLATVLVNDMTVHYKEDETTIDWIEKADGTELWDLTFDTAGALKGATILSPAGEERTYVNGKLAELRRPDQTRLVYANDKVSQMITSESLTYNFTHTTSKIEANLLQGTTPPDALTPVKMEYDLNFNLQKVTRQNQEILSYLNTDLKQIDAPNNAPKVFNYVKDAAGKVLSYTVTQGNVVTNYDANNQPVSSVISPTTGNPDTFNVTYQYGKIRQIKKNGNVAFNYTYTTDANGIELTVIDDVFGNSTKQYVGEDLITSLDRATNVLSTYEYVDNKVSKVTVSRFGRTLHVYDYSLSSGNTVVKDETGVIRTYDSNQRLIFLERDGEKYAYNYSVQLIQIVNGPPVVTETTLPVTLYQTTARSVRPWDGQAAWYSYEQPYGKDYLQTHWADNWVEYDITMAAAGDLKINLEATDSGTIPASYPNFLLDFSVDGAAKGTMSVAAAANNVWNSGAVTLTGLTQGTHKIRLKFANFVSNTTGQSDFKFRNISFKQAVTLPSLTTQNQDIVEESLVEKKLADGSKIYYTNGKVNQINHADGRVFKNFVVDEQGNLTKATVFPNTSSTAGTHVYFKNGVIDKVVLPTNEEISYRYDLDTNGNLIRTWLDKGTLNLKYDASEKLLGLTFDGILNPDEVKADTTHTYTGGVGFLSTDGDFNTAQYESLRHWSGGIGNVTSEHSFPQPETVTSVTFSMQAYGRADGSYIKDYEALYYVEVFRNGVWEQVPGSFGGTYKINGGGAYNAVSGQVTLNNLNLTNVTKLRAYAHGFGNSSDNANADGMARINEIQWSLADLSAMAYSQSSGNHILTGHQGSIKFNSSGSLTQPNSAYTSVQQQLTGVIQNYATLTHSNSDFDLVQQVFMDRQLVTVQEYSKDGTLETQTKADGTVTLFQNNKPTRVLSSAGTVLIEYAYDGQGNPTRVYLKNARDTLPDEVAEARLQIETQRADALRTLAQQKNLAYQTIQSQSQQIKQAYLDQMGSYQVQFDQIAATSAKGKEAKSARGDALNQVGSIMDQIRQLLIDATAQEADAYAALDAQVKTLSDQIEADTQTAVTHLGVQETNLKREVLRQEVSPIVYDHYRRILGRDPDTTEYNYWLDRVDYNQNATLAETKTTTGTNLTAALVSHINALPELAQRQAYVAAIKSAVATQINSYVAMTQAQKETFAATLGLTAADLIPLSSGDATKILQWLSSRSLHFGQSAFLSLESLLDQKSKVYTRETLAKQAILIDILSGVISPLDDGDLVISIFALNKTGKLYGVDLNGAKMSWDDLKSIYDTRGVVIGEQPVTAQLPGSSIKFDGAGDHLTVPASNDWTLGQGDFTIELWAKPTTVGKYQYLAWSGTHPSSYGWSLALTNSNQIIFTTGTGAWVTAMDYYSATQSLQAGSWHHFAVQRKGNTLGIYLNGNLLTGYSTAISDFSMVSNPLVVGYYTIGYYYFDGNMDGLRISKGIGRYTGNFTPSTVRHTADSFTKFLLYADSQAGIKDFSASSHTITRMDNVTTDTSYKQTIPQVTYKKVITKYPASITNPSSLTQAQKDDILNNPDKYNPRVIAHINGNHYVIVTSMTADSITYIDPGVGKDKLNESITVSKEGFLKAWQGNVTLNQADYAPVQSRVSAGQSQAKVLSAAEAKSIRGAFWGSILGLIGSIFVWIPLLNPIGLALSAISIGISAIEGDWISAISSLVTLGIAPNGLGSFFKDVFSGLTGAMGGLGAMFNQVGGFIQNVYTAVTGIFGSISSGIGGFLHNTFGISTKIAGEIARTAVSVGINVGATKGLEAVGVSPQIAGFLGSLAAGAVVGGLSPEAKNLSQTAVSRADMIKTSVQQTLTLQNIGQLGMQLGLDSAFTQIVGLSLGAIQGTLIQNPGTSLEQAFSAIKPQLGGSLALYGLEKVGSAIGIDPRITSTIGLTLSHAMDAKLEGQSIITGVLQGVATGAVTLGVQALTKDLSPIMGALAARAASGLIAGLISSDHNPFYGVLNAYSASFESVLRLGGSGDSTYQQMAYLSKVQDFSSVIQQKGLGAALEQYATSFFYRDSIDSIVASAGTVANHIQKMIAEGRASATIANGKDALKIPLNQDGSQYILVSEDQKNLLGRKLNGLYEEGTYITTPDGQVFLKTGTQSMDAVDGEFAIASKENGQYKQISLYGKDKHLILTPANGKALNVVQNDDGLTVIDGSVEDLIAGTTMTYMDGRLQTRDTNVASLKLTYDSTQQRYLLTPQESFLEERYSWEAGGDLTSIRLLEHRPDRENPYNPEVPDPPDTAPGHGGATVPNITLSATEIAALKAKLGPSFSPTGPSIQIIFLPGPNGMSIMGAMGASGAIVSGMGSFTENENPDPQKPGFVDRVNDWIRGVGESTKNFIANFNTGDLVRVRPTDREALRGNPNDLIRVRHNTTPEQAAQILNSGKLLPSADGKIYVENPDAVITNGVISQDPLLKANELGIDPAKGTAGVDFYVRRGDLSLASNPRTGNMDITISGEISLTGRFAESFARVGNE